MSGSTAVVLFVILGVVTLMAAVVAFAIVARSKFPAPAATARATTAVSAEPRVPTPDAGQRAAYLAALEGIDRGLVVNEDRAIRRGRAVCDRILHPSGGTMTLREYVVAELSGGNATIDQAQATKVVAAVKVWCR